MNTIKLFNLPNELVHIISSYLPKQSISQLCLTCINGYQVFLPILYEHVELRHRTQIKQLKDGILRNKFLKDVVSNYTQALSLKCRQGGNSHWLILSLFEQLLNVKKLYFHDFPALSMDKVQQILQSLPRLTHLSFQYCDLTTTATTTRNTVQFLPNLIELNLLWTDFTTMAISELFGFAPNLTSVSLGANRNRKPFANDSALTALTHNCPKVTQLSVSLQQVKEISICQAMQHYGQQLTHLSVRCEGNNTMKTISQYNQKLEHLNIRCNNYTIIQSSNIIHLLQKCNQLNHLEMIGWPIQNLPSTILDHIHHRESTTISLHSLSIETSGVSTETNTYANVDSSIFINNDRQQDSQSSNTNFLQGVQKTVALDGNDLQEIRRLCVYLCKGE